MTDKPITYRSGPVTPGRYSSILGEAINSNGVNCTWNGRANQNNFDETITGFTLWWEFDWSELKNTGVDELSGYITVTSPDEWLSPHKIKFRFADTTGKAVTNIYIGVRDSTCSLVYEYNLHPHRSSVKEVKTEEVFYEAMFLPSAKNDTVLLVDGKKLHVNKAFLSYHSDFFSALFSSNFKEGQMDEIPIQEVTFEDFGLIMSTIYPNTVYPNDKNVTKLLELADRFMLPSIIRHVEYHLIHNSKLDYEKMTWMADAYGMTELLEKCVMEFSTIERVKKLKASEEYMKISEKTKAKIFDRLFLYL